MPSLHDMLAVSHVQIKQIRDYLDHLDPEVRLREIRQLGKKEQQNLFHAARGFMSLTLDDIVPANIPVMQEVVHEGKNTLPVPAFSQFTKVFVRPDGAEEKNGELWGYNRTSDLLQTSVGPGYFVLHAHHQHGELIVNYLRLPPRKPFHWPPILDNSQRLSFFVYNQTQDILRGVSKHVTIGGVQKQGKWLPAWFILCRKD